MDGNGKEGIGRVDWEGKARREVGRGGTSGNGRMEGQEEHSAK